MKLRDMSVGILLILLLAGCGVPRAALEQARVEAAIVKVLPTEEAQVRETLRRQAERWEAFAQILHQREPGGIWWVDENFVALVERTAALARRQVELINTNQDRPEINHAVLTEMAGLWREAQNYLGP